MFVMCIMGVYAIYSDKSFKTDKELKMKRKRSRLDRNMELIKDSRLIFNHNTQTIEVIKDDIEEVRQNGR